MQCNRRPEGGSDLSVCRYSLRSDSYLAAASALPASATAPNCLINPRASQLTQPSTIFPPAKRATLIPVMEICFPVGAIPFSSPLWVPRQLQRAVIVSPSERSSSTVRRKSWKALRYRVALFFSPRARAQDLAWKRHDECSLARIARLRLADYLCSKPLRTNDER